MCKTLLEILKKKSKTYYYSNLIEKYENYFKRTWDMKEIIGKSKFKIKKLSHRIVLDEKEKDFSKVFDRVNYKMLI